MEMKANTIFIPTKKGLKMVDDSIIKKEIDEFEQGFPDGVYAIPREKNEPRLNVRKMDAFCRENQIDPDQLTEKQMEQFYIYD